MATSHSSPLIVGEKYLTLLKALYFLNTKQRKQFLLRAYKQVIKIICECALNILRGNFKFERTKHKTTLRKYAKILRRLSSLYGTWSGRRRLVIQSRGALLTALLTPLLFNVHTRSDGQ